MLLERDLGEVLDAANPNNFPRAMANAKPGAAYRGVLRCAVVAANASAICVLPDEAKAVALASVYVRSGANAGYKEPVNPGATLAANQAKITPTGDVIITAAASTPEVEIWYWSAEQTPITADIAVVAATGVGTLPQGYEGMTLLAAEATAGTVTGDATVIARGGTPATGEAALAASGAAVQFLIADAVTRATITFLPVPGVGPAPKSVAAKMDDTVAL